MNRTGAVPTAPPAAADSTGPSRLRDFLSRRQRPVLGTISVVVFIVLWELSAQLGLINPLFTSYPTAIAEAAAQTWADGTLGTNFRASAELFVAGFLLSVVVAIPLGILMGWYRWFDAIVDPFVSILYATPRIALIPLVLVWAGIGFESRLIIVVLAAMFPLLINTIAGVRATDPQLLRVSRSFMGRDIDVFRTLVLPGAMPYIVSGLRHAINQALIGVVVAEFFGGSVGLGAMITSAGLELRTDIAFVGVLIIAACALLLTSALRLMETKLTRWRE